MKLHARSHFGWQGDSELFQVHTSAPGLCELLPLTSGSRSRRLVPDAPKNEGEASMPKDLDYLAVGDVLRLSPKASEMRVLYRRNSSHNSLFFTEQCNSRCVMCSQPPRNVQDDHLIREILQMIPFLSVETAELGITGGEPTLVGEKLFEVLSSLRNHLPRTAVHLLTNGRNFRFLRYSRSLAAVQHPDLMLGIPLYADTAARHDFVVQAAGAFEETIFGLLTLARVGVRLEIRIVVHLQTFRRLPELAHYIARNLPFVEQVVIMGLELMGFARTNLDALWIDPADYQAELENCIDTLDGAGIAVRIYNHPLCLLRPSLHRFNSRSISDWKNVYLPGCASCARKAECGGFFSSSELRQPREVFPFQSDAIA